MSEEQQIRVYIDTLLCLFRDGLARPILGTYKQSYSKANYMWHVRNALKPEKHGLNGGMFRSEEMLVEQLEPLAWLRLMHRRWRKLFEGRLGKIGRKHLDTLYDTRNRWAHHDPISLDQALAATEATIFFLDAYRAKEVGSAREIYQALLEFQQSSEFSEQPQAAFTLEGPSQMDVVPLFKPSPPVNGLDGITIGVEPINKTGRFCLQIIEPENQPRIEYLPENFHQVIVGRSSDCTITIHDSQASRSHFMLEQGNQNSLILTDLTSRNGTYYKGNRLPDSQPVRWLVGQQIQIGRTVLILRYDMDL
ncbi:MAG: FHA domain-containing protein [Anaerolineaceae bacterium]|nr:FHA domain-containing protein [Anaerolineaceae bacterium]